MRPHPRRRKKTDLLMVHFAASDPFGHRLGPFNPTQAGLLFCQTVGRTMLTESTTREARAEVRAEIEVFQQGLTTGGPTEKPKP